MIIKYNNINNDNERKVKWECLEGKWGSLRRRAPLKDWEGCEGKAHYGFQQLVDLKKAAFKNELT